MNTADFQSFNDGFDYAVEKICEANSNGHFGYITLVSIVRRFRWDRWWREGTDAAIEWAERNGREEKTSLYRDPAR